MTDYVVFYADGDAAYELVHGVLPEEYATEYERVGEFLGDPKQDYYQGMDWTTVIRRKSDGKLYGFSWWQGGGKYGEEWHDSNGHEFGLEYRDSEDGEEDYPYVFTPVKEFTLTGYEVIK